MKMSISRQDRIVYSLFWIPVISAIHCLLQYIIFSLMIGWDYNPPEKEWVPSFFCIVFYCLNPLGVLVGYLDSSVIRLKDSWYYASSIASAVTWSAAIVWFYFRRREKNCGISTMWPFILFFAFMIYAGIRADGSWLPMTVVLFAVITSLISYFLIKRFGPSGRSSQ